MSQIGENAPVSAEQKAEVAPRIVESSFEPDTLAWCGIDASKVPDLPRFLDECAAKFDALAEEAMEKAAWRAVESLGLDSDTISMED